MKRKSMSKKLRFEVFKRDKFTCQYCGRVAPDVVLHLDHIEPVAEGGTNDILNLVTSCEDCNSGKGARELSDDAVVIKSRKEMQSQLEREEQIKMMLDIKRKQNEAPPEVEAFETYFQACYGVGLTNTGRVDAGKIIKKYGLNEIFDCMDLAREKYQEPQEAFSKIERIAQSRAKNREQPGRAEVVHLTNYVMKKFGLNKQSWQNVFNLVEIRFFYDECDTALIWGYARAAKSPDDFLSAPQLVVDKVCGVIWSRFEDKYDIDLQDKHDEHMDNLMSYLIFKIGPLKIISAIDKNENHIDCLDAIEEMRNG